MANVKVIVLKTIQYKNEKEVNVTVEPAEDAQAVPSDIAKEAIDRGLARKPEKASVKKAAVPVEPDAESTDQAE